MCANVTGCPSDDVCPLGSRCCLQKNCSKKCVKVEILPPPPPTCKCFMNKLCITRLGNSVWLLRMSECPLWNLFLTQTSKLIFLTISGKIVYWYGPLFWANPLTCMLQWARVEYWMLCFFAVLLQCPVLNPIPSCALPPDAPPNCFTGGPKCPTGKTCCLDNDCYHKCVKPARPDGEF